MSLITFKNKKILIVGLGISNIAVIKYLADKKLGLLTITDLKSKNELKENINTVKKIFPNAHFVLGKHNINDFISSDIVIRSPSIFLNNFFIKKAINAGVPVETDVSIFFKLISSSNTIGVTGTKGKTTTSTFLYKVISDQGFDVVLAGNMGIPIMESLEKVGPKTWVVAELSSYMCASLGRYKISPKVAVYTNLFSDHLDKYKTFEDYKNDKKALFLNQKKSDILLINKNDKELKTFIDQAKSQVLFFSKENIPNNLTLQVKGPHYRDNIASAFVLAKKLNWNMNKVKKTAKDFAGLEHRMEYLGIINQIEFINNSAATNPGAFLADMQVIIKKSKPIFLLCGGSDKNLDFKKMADLINNADLIKGLVLFNGAGTNKLCKYLNSNKIIYICTSMPRAFKKIIKKAVKKSIVILNPGCASFGVFKNEFDRGEQFKEQVRKYKKANT